MTPHQNAASAGRIHQPRVRRRQVQEPARSGLFWHPLFQPACWVAGYFDGEPAICFGLFRRLTG